MGEDFLRNEERVVMRYNSVLDLHTHTLVSGHAYCSLREMAKAASKKGLEVLGITEHAPAMPGTWMRRELWIWRSGRWRGWMW